MRTPLHHYDSWSTSLKTSSIPSNCFLSGIGVFDVDDEGQLVGTPQDSGYEVAQATISSGTAEVTTSGLSLDSAAAIAIPIFRGGTVTSVVCFFARAKDDTVTEPIGVFEVWEPIGPFEEVALKAGYYGDMERFQNVSSFVRFEKGSGLPGQVWKRRSSVIQDKLAEHPGFLRAAGASADLLRTAVGIPVANDEFHSAAVLISSQNTPIARGMEVWQVCPDSNDFELSDAAYYQLGDGYALPRGTIASCDEAMLGKVLQVKRAILTDDPDMLLAGRSADAALPGPTSGLAIPFFDGLTLTSVTILLF